jgi:phosphoserine phosphatase
MLQLVGHPFAINPTKELIANILKDAHLKDAATIIVERKDVTYQLNVDSLHLI